MPDEDGKIVVDFDDLFVDAGSDQVTITPPGEEVPTEAPVAAVGAGELPAVAAGLEPDLAAVPAPEAVPGEEDEEDLTLPTESVSYKDYQRVLSNISERIDRSLYSNNVSDISRASLKQRLFHLLEAVDTMRDRGIISNRQASLNENKLEFLFLKLKEAGLHNSYSVSNEEGTDMKTLKEFAAQLFEEDENLAKDSASSGDTGMPVDDEYSAHAADVSGVDPKLGKKKDVAVAQSRHLGEGEALEDTDNAEEKPWDEGEPGLKENSADADTDANDDVAEGAAGFGDTREEPEAEPFEVDDAELAEAVRSIRKENIKGKLAALREAEKAEHSSDLGKEAKASEDYPDPGPEGGKEPAQEHLEEQIELEMEDEVEVVDDDESMGDDLDDVELDDGADDGVGDLVLTIDLPPEVEEELAALGIDDLDVDVDLNVAMDVDGDDDAGEVDLDDDGGDELGDELGDGDVDDMGPESEEEEMVLMDDEGPEDEMNMESKKLARRARLLEKKLRRAARLLETKNKEVTDLKGQLVETNLFTSKAVYYSKFLQRALTEKALTKKALQQIVEHLDKGKSVAETKAIFKKIERKLNEHANASRKLGGSSSKVTKPGSASLNESANSHASNDPNSQSVSRWQMLAGIKKGE